MKLKNGFFVTVKTITDDQLVSSSGPYDSAMTAEIAAAVVASHIDVDLFYSDFAWYGPRPEPVAA